MGTSQRALNRRASVKLLESIGYDPADVADPGTGRLELDGDTVIIPVAQRDGNGRVRFEAGQFVTRSVRVALEPAAAAEYRQATS